jgi:hypothetical protein
MRDGHGVGAHASPQGACSCTTLPALISAQLSGSERLGVELQHHDGTDERQIQVRIGRGRTVAGKCFPVDITPASCKSSMNGIAPSSTIAGVAPKERPSAPMTGLSGFVLTSR